MISNFKNLVWGVKVVYLICGAATYILALPAMATHIHPTKEDIPTTKTILTATLTLSAPQLDGQAETSLKVTDGLVRDDGEQETLEVLNSPIISEEDVTVGDISITLANDFAPLSANPFNRPEVKEIEASFSPTNILPTPSFTTKATPSEALEIIRRQDQLQRFQSPVNSQLISQATNVHQLRDVAPGDWAYEALRHLIERYGCIAGYPEGTFRGNSVMTRDEFAAGLNACLNQIERLLQENSTVSQENSIVLREDLEKLQRLAKDFEVELANLDTKVDNLEGRVAFLEDHQFSPTAWLNGTAVFGLATAGGGDPPGRGETNSTLNYLTFLGVSASFTGQDVLRVGLSAGNFDAGSFANPQALNTNMALLSYQTDTDNQLELNSLEYRFVVGDRLGIVIKPAGFGLSTVLDTLSPYQSSVQGNLSRFAAYSPIYRIGSLNGGVGLDFLLTNQVQLQVAYGSRNANNSDQGLFSSNHRALGAQFLFFETPKSKFKTALTYVNAFSSNGRLDTFTGSNNADISGGFNERATIHAINGSLEWRLTPNLTFGTWGGAIITDSLESDAAVLSTTYLFSLGISDLFGREGDLLAFMVGQPPRLRTGVNILREDEGSSLHYEIFYRFRLNDYISITPGFFFVTDPGHISENDDIFVGAIRTTFSF